MSEPPEPRETHPMNQHDAETRQFLALVEKDRPILAAMLAFSRTSAGVKAVRILGGIAFGVLALVSGMPQTIFAQIANSLL